MISNDSIVGKALLGKKSGDIVKIKTHSGAFEYKIKEIN
jgi:transcription elongation GreA/GreB family factor